MAHTIPYSNEQIDEAIGKGLVSQRETLTGTGEPASDLGEDGQFYVDTDNAKLYFKDDGEWTSVGGGGGSAARYYSVSVPTTGWTQDSTANWYTQTISVTGLLATDRPSVDVDLSSATDSDDVEAMLATWGNLFRFTANDGELVCYSSQVPVAALTITLECK